MTATATLTPVLAIECPECYAQVRFNLAPILHEILPCGECGVELEVVVVEPLRVELAPEVEEDWGE